MGMDEIPEDLFKKLLAGACSEAEAAQLIAQLAEGRGNSVYEDLVLAQLTEKPDMAALPESVRENLRLRLEKIVAQDDQPATFHRKKRFWERPWLGYTAAAAAIAAVLLVIFSGNQLHPVQRSTAFIARTSDAVPGKNQAVLTLADGRKILLAETANGELAKEAGIRVTKTAEGKIVYRVSAAPSQPEGSPLTYNTISTPRGGQYQVNLPDGTRVWLNSASAIKFPVAFSAAAKRQVSLRGEAYFEVAKDPARPFLVETEKQAVEVLGTHFDISSYAEDASTKTTLLEGSVRLYTGQKTFLLKPGQQAEVAAAVTVLQVDTETAVAWKNGYFSFDDEELVSAMRKVARWYDLEVEFSDPALQHIRIAAYSTRFANVSGLLKRLNQLGDARFKLQGRTLTVSKIK